MEENRFFKTVWRFNGVVISIAGILAIGVLLFVTYKLYQDVTRDRTTHNIVNVGDSAEVKENWTLGAMTSINGSPFIMIPLKSDQSFERAYYSKSSSSIRNYLFLNTDKNTKRWLFNHSNNLIESREFIQLGDYDSKEPVIAILYKVINLDSNEDNRLTLKDSKTVALSKPDGTGYKEILTNVDVFVGSKITEQDNLLVIYQRNGIGFSANINLTDFIVREQSELPKVGI